MMDMQDNQKFIINNFGSFTLYDVLLDVGYPTIFICKDEFSAFYLFYETDYDQTFTEWLLMRITKTQYWDLKTGLLSLQTTFKSSLENKWFKFKEIGNEQELHIYETFPEHLFTSQAEYFISGEQTNDENYLLAQSHAQEKPILDVKFNTPSLPSKSDEEISVRIRVLETYVSIFRMFFKDFGVEDSAMNVSLAKGSTIIRFSFEEENLFTSQSVANSFRALNSALSGDEPEEIVNAFKGDKVKINRFNNLIHTISKSNSDIAIIAAAPAENAKVYKSVNNETIIKLKEVVANIAVDEEPVDEIIVGHVYSANVDNKKIEFLFENTKIKADLSHELSKTQIVINKSYELYVKKIEKKYLNGTIKETKYIVNSLKTK